jgi:pilus assembly protein CpaD
MKPYITKAVLVSLAFTLAGCGGIATNRRLDSIHQPVVERLNYTLDVVTGPGGLSYPEQRRIAGWFEAMDLRYGDRITIDDPMRSSATLAAVAALADRYGLLVSGQAPVTAGYVNAGNARVIVTRTKATVAGCPDWSAKSDSNPMSATSTNYGCATNANFASMVANPEHLLKGERGGSDTLIMSSNKAIGSYREAKPTGEKGLKIEQTSGK